MKKVGIYSGTFDPVHEGHVGFALEAAKQCGLEKVFFLVEPRPRRKQGVKALEHRAEMVRLAVQHEPKLGSILLEQQRFSAADTLPVLQQRFKGAELHMLMGDDMLGHFADWPHVESLIKNIRFAIGIRSHAKTDVTKRLKDIQKAKGLAMNYCLFRAPGASYASRKIRQAIRSGKPPQGLAPEVMEYVLATGLYASSKLGS